MKEACEFVRTGDDQLTGFWVRTFMLLGKNIYDEDIRSN